MSFQNATRFQASCLPTRGIDGAAVVLVVVKATFDVLPDGRTVPSDEPFPVRTNDVLWTDAAMSSVRLPTDVLLDKRGCDVVVVGEAISPRPVRAVDVLIRVGQHAAPLRVHGERLFAKGSADVVIGPAAPFERMPIVYEKAYGGTSDDFTVTEEQNPIGVGVDKKKSDLVDRPAPQIEHPLRPHTTASDRHPPMGCGAVMTHWLPRRAFAGTFDDVWLQTRMPLMPLDFDARFHNVAHPSLILETPPPAGTVVAIAGMTAAPLTFALPAWTVVVRTRTDGGKRALPLVLDTLVVHPGRARFELAARCTLPVGRGRDVLREVSVDDEA